MKGFRNDRGQAGIALIIVIAWALSAVLILTRTLVAAQEINNKVTDITGKLAGAKGDTSYVAQLNMTENTANAILAAAAPLTGQIEIIKTTAAHIQKQVDEITPPVQTINSTVHVIHDQVGSILATANSIKGILATIRDTQSSVILKDVVRIKFDTTSIIRNVHTIDANLCHADKTLGDGTNQDPQCGNSTVEPPGA